LDLFYLQNGRPFPEALAEKHRHFTAHYGDMRRDKLDKLSHPAFAVVRFGPRLVGGADLGKPSAGRKIVASRKDRLFVMAKASRPGILL
jgi:hypothetical protein